MEKVAPGLRDMYIDAGLGDKNVEVPTALVDAWDYYVRLQETCEELKKNMLQPVATKNAAMERFRNRLGVMNSQSRAQQVLDEAEEKLEKWLQDQLASWQRKIDDVSQSMSEQMQLIHDLFQAELPKYVRSTSVETLQEDSQIESLQSAVDALVLECDSSISVPCQD